MERYHVISFDVEEHYRIEAAAGLACPDGRAAEYGARMETTTRRLLDLLADAGARATFFVVGEIARQYPKLVRAIHDAGHEVGSHSLSHRRVHHFTPASLREDLLQSKDALEQAAGASVVGFRAPTFSIVRETGWAIDVLAECGFEYDSSIFPVRHDRYGIPDAPRVPFWAHGREQRLLELPLLTYRVAGLNLPVAGGGYFRLFPLRVLRAGLEQMDRQSGGAAILYFHPWEFDPEQPRLPLGRLARWRTYVGMRRTMNRLRSLLRRYEYTRAVDVARALRAGHTDLPSYSLMAAA